MSSINARQKLAVGVIAIALAALTGRGVTAEPESGKSAFTPETIREVYDEFKEALVVVEYSIEYYDPRRQQEVKRDLHCLGVVVDRSGLVMVRGHVSLANVKPFNVRVRMDSGTRYDATVLQKDRRINVAFLKLTPSAEDEDNGGLDLPFVPFAESPSLNVGDEIMVLGILPEVLDYEKTFHVGRVASVIETPRRVYTTDFAVPYGMVGGPVINASGEVVGVIGYDLSSREGGDIYVRAGYPLLYTADLFQHLIDNPPTEEEDLEEAWLGVFIQPLTDDLAEYWELEKTGGVVASTIIKDSPAERAGVKRGDVIKVFDGKPVTFKEDGEMRGFTRLVRESGIGKNVPVTVMRDGQEVQLSVLLEETPKTTAEAEKHEDKEFGLTVREITADFIIVSDLDPDVKGVVVDRVQGAGWASLGGLVPGDIVKEIDGKQVTALDDFKEILADIKDRKPKQIAVFIERGRRTGFMRIEPDWED